jgi:hypothetical protein
MPAWFWIDHSSGCPLCAEMIYVVEKLTNDYHDRLMVLNHGYMNLSI